jgi:hypothetical protein
VCTANHFGSDMRSGPCPAKEKTCESALRPMLAIIASFRPQRVQRDGFRVVQNHLLNRDLFTRKI